VDKAVIPQRSAMKADISPSGKVYLTTDLFLSAQSSMPIGGLSSSFIISRV
jgi:hypothetical protein